MIRSHYIAIAVYCYNRNTVAIPRLAQQERLRRVEIHADFEGSARLEKFAVKHGYVYPSKISSFV